jgi:hypothetical protein
MVLGSVRRSLYFSAQAVELSVSLLRFFMRTLTALSIFALAVACQRTPQQQQNDKLRQDAQLQGAAIENQADTQANQLESKAAALHNGAQQAGGYTGRRLNVRADALDKEAGLIRKQADMQADAVREAADAKVKASESR